MRFSKVPGKRFFLTQKVSRKFPRKRFHVFLLNAPIFRARKWARNFNSDNSRVLSEDPENVSGDFSTGKISACKHWLTKSAECLHKPVFTLKKHTMERILLKQTDSEIYFDVGYNKKENLSD